MHFNKGIDEEVKPKRKTFSDIQKETKTQYKEVNIEEDLPEVKDSCSLVEVIKLPSRYKSYPIKDNIFYTTYTYKDIKILSEDSISDYAKNLVILQNIKTKFDKSLMTFYDFIYVAFLMKLSIFKTSEFSFKYVCKCSKDIKTKRFTLQDIIHFTELEVPDFPINVTFSDGITKSFMPLTIKDYLFLTKNEFSMFSLDGQEYNDPIAQLACCAGGDYKENYDYLSSLRNPEDTSLLQIVEDSLYHGLEPYVFNCKCGQKHSVEFLGGELMIFPFYESNPISNNRISYGPIN